MMSAHALDPAFAIAAGQVRDGTVPFVILGVAGADGVARLDAFPPVEGPRIGTNAVCLLASITKPIVAVAVMRLVQDGRFPLTAPLSRWLPELDAAGLAPFTAWHVLTHTSGIGDVDLERLLREGGDRPELIRRTIAAGQDSPPGSQFRYASVTFDLLVEAVERAVGRPFDTVLRETLLDPLGMSDTTFDPAPSGARRAPVVVGGWDGTHRALGAGADTEGMVTRYASLRLAGGGLWSTAHDLLRFGRAMLRGGELDGVRILGRPIVDLMTREVTVNGLGATADRLDRRPLRDRLGQARGRVAGVTARIRTRRRVRTRLWIDPAYDLVYVYLTGLWGAPIQTIDAVELALYGSIE